MRNVDRETQGDYPYAMHAEESSEKMWETYCNRCGLCCFEKIEDESGTVFFTSTPCRYLDVATRRCKIYERRFAINPECIKLTPELVEGLRWLHDGCGYRQALGIKRVRRNERNGNGDTI